MSDESGAEDSEGAGSVLSVLQDTVGDLVTGVPAPIRKNALKAFSRLCTAAVEYPVALIENAIAEKQAESQSRVKLINASADQIARQMQTDPEYARAAAKKFAQKIIRERVNVDQIVGFAAAELKSTAGGSPNKEEPESAPLDDDWLNVFENEGAQLSSEQMQRMFGKILAGEIQRPTSYSIKAIKIIAQLDQRAAALFNRLCSLSISIRLPNKTVMDARVVSFGNAGQNSLMPHGLGFDALNALQEHGLIISDYNSYSDYQAAVAYQNTVVLPFVYQSNSYAFFPKIPLTERQEFRVVGVALSRAGRELLSIVDIQPDEGYKSALIKFFEQQGMTVTTVNLGP
jgi:hypothetical protein